MAKLDWEQLQHQNVDGYAYRARVFGGWLVRVENVVPTYESTGPGYFTQQHSNAHVQVALAFVPDPNGEWQ